MRKMAIHCLAAPIVIVMLTGLPLDAQTRERIDAEANKSFRTNGLEKGQVMEILSWICDVHGPRLTCSPNLRRAQKWALSRFEEWGLEKAHLEEWGPFGLGWQLDHFSMEVTGQNPWPIHAWPKAWSPGIPEATTAEVVDVSGKSVDEIKAMNLRGKIVLMQATRKVNEPFEADARRHDPESLIALADGVRRSRQGARRRGRGQFDRTAFMQRRARQRLVFEQEPLAILDRSSKGDYGTIFVSGASVPSDQDTPRNERPSARNPRGHKVIPQITLAVEHYNRIQRLLEKKVPVHVSLSMKATFFDDDLMARNVIAEIPGTDPKIGDELVMLGAHFDSWHSSTGATDNGAGSAVMMEAMRLIKTLVKERGKGPRRTIRVALWSGEEQGLLGSRAYVSRHFAERGGRRGPPSELKPAYEKLSGYFNLDNGTGRIRGVYMQGNEAVRPIFRAWLRPFHDLEASTLTLNNTGGTDHQAFDGVGLPGFQFIQDTVSYSTRTHHSNMDNWDHAVAGDLKQAATIIASFAWHTAQRNEKLPRKPTPAARPAPRSGEPRR